jgi:hypothetical protein
VEEGIRWTLHTHFSKCMNYELTIRQSFTKLRRILGNNFAGERKRSSKHEHGGEGVLL